MRAGYARRLPFGADWLGDGRARFRLWAPAQDSVSLEIAGQRPQPMTRQADGTFEIVASCAPGAAYLYRFASGPAVPDPASRAQLQGVHGPSLVVDPASYAWKNTSWRGRPWHETVLYELHTGLCGGFEGVGRHLPRLAELGITAVELMPVNDFPGTRNWGYDGVLPFSPASAYGLPDQLKALIDEAHGLGVMMFLDVVYNHFGPDGNYMSVGAPGFFRDDIQTPWGPAIDFRRKQVRRFFIENALYWLMEYRFDGLRFDAVHAIADPTFLDEMAAEIRNTVETGRQVHLVLEHDGNDAAHLRGDYDAQWNDDAHHCLHVLLTGERDGYYEDYAGKPAQLLARCLAEGFAYQGEPSRHRGGQTRGTKSGDLPPTSFVLFLQNHDQVGNRPLGDRLTTRVPHDALEAAAALQLLAPSIPLLFMGEEQESRTPFQFFTDYTGDLARAVREGRRSEFKAFKGFSAEDIPDPNDPATFERSRIQPGYRPAELYRHLLALRHREIVPRLPGCRALEAETFGGHTIVARWQMGDGSRLTIATNFGAEESACGLPAAAPLFETRPGVAGTNRLSAHATAAWLER